MLPRIFVETEITDPDTPQLRDAHVVSVEKIQLCNCQIGWDGVRIPPVHLATMATLRNVRLCNDSINIIKAQLTSLEKWRGYLRDDEFAALQEVKFQ